MQSSRVGVLALVLVRGTVQGQKHRLKTPRSCKETFKMTLSADDERRTRYAQEREERERRLQEIEDRSRRRMAEDEAALVKLYGKETFDQRRARYAKVREAYVQAAKDRLGRVRPSHHDHDTWGGCDLCLWYEVYPDGNGPSVNQDRSGKGPQ